jgi:phosphoenolpyruvate-protein kinase (PTS system EI component)
MSSEFDNAFNNASIGSGINKVNVTGKQEESINPQENKQISSENDTEIVLQTSVTNAPAEQALRKRERKKKDAGTVDANSTTTVGHFSCICDSKLIAQVRAIAWQEHMTVRAVVESMFSKCITKYEKKRGPIQIETSQPTEELF